MKCPFWYRLEKRIEDKFDSAGQKIGEEEVTYLSHNDCMGEDCELFDKESQQCLFLSLNKNLSLVLENLSSLPDRLKSDIDGSLYEKSEMLSVVISSGFQHLQDAFKSYGEKIADGMANLVPETKATKDFLSALLEKVEGFLTQQTELRDSVNKELQVMLSLKESLDRFSERGKTLERALIDVVNALAKREEI